MVPPGPISKEIESVSGNSFNFLFPSNPFVPIPKTSDEMDDVHWTVMISGRERDVIKRMRTKAMNAFCVNTLFFENKP